LLNRTKQLLEQIKYPPTQEQQQEFNRIDNTRHDGVKYAERCYRKLCMGQVDFSPAIQQARRAITAWTYLKNKSKGLKVSSHLLQRSMKKANIEHHIRFMGQAFINEQLHLAYKHYYAIKGSHRELRNTHMESRAEALAAEGNTDKEKILKTLRHHERQRSTAKKIRHLRGKTSTGSTTMVTIQDESGKWVGITNKEDIECAIMKKKQRKIRTILPSAILATTVG
jgi:hypothetical protein